MRTLLMVGIFSVVSFVTLFSQSALAHRSGCHTLHSCPSDTTTYVCGDLGYPCNGVTSINDVALEDIAVPVLVEATFEQVFERAPSELESVYWKKRFRDDKGSLTKIRRAMRWHKAAGSFGPAPATISPTGLVTKLNALFRVAYDGRNPTISENQYWISRVGDKVTEAAMHGAMLWHRQNGVEH